MDQRMEFRNSFFFLSLSFWYFLESNPYHLEMISVVLTEDLTVLKRNIKRENNLILTINSVIVMLSNS